MSMIGEHAVVTGAGMAGLLAARAASEFYRSVTIVERDVLPDSPVHRKGVPQGRHLHSVLSRGVSVLDMLFPGFVDELGAAGAVVVDDPDLSRVYARVGAHELSQSGTLADPAALRFYLASRPFTEIHVRRRVQALDNVTFLDGHDVGGPIIQGDTITGLRMIDCANRTESVLDCDLVIDAAGRASRTPLLLESLGYGRPAEQTDSSDWAYSSQLMTLTEPGFPERMAMANNGSRRPRALLLAQEHDHWMLAIARAAETGPPPSDFAGMLATAGEMLPARIIAGLRRAEPVGEVATVRKTQAVWRRYDLMPRFPAGLLVTGDALCSLNPLYGQGMTMATLDALAMRECLRAGPSRLRERYFAATARHLSSTWALNQTNDRIPPPAIARPKAAERLQKWMRLAAIEAAGSDIRVTEQLLRVNGLIDPPARLRHPALVSRILIGKIRMCSRGTDRRTTSLVSRIVASRNPRPHVAG
ncbi:MAG: FAD-dependent oxidoreductase [Mycolicibacterium mageritense]|nr:FAD-dependent oxidoreductase [Mycolicibacterium mageritense]TXI63613.1 MAG: FAD-dependent oxidoreductase [Mycolicibacterium mageritense]